MLALMNEIIKRVSPIEGIKNIQHVSKKKQN